MSLPIGGDFSPSDLLNIQTAAEEIWQDDLRKVDYTAYVDTAIIVGESQTADFHELQNPVKDRTHMINWIADCDEEPPTDCDDDCDIAGEQAGTLSETYALDICFQKKFTVPEKQFRTNLFNQESVIAIQMLRKMKLMDEEWTRRLVDKIDLFKGTNMDDLEFTFDAGTSDTYIPATSWTPDIMTYFIQSMILNKLTNSYLLSGNQLFRQARKAELEAGNGEGKGAMAKMKQMEVKWDLFNIDGQVGRKVFMINPNSFAWVTKNYYPGNPIIYTGQNIGQKRYSIPSFNIPGLVYDIFYTIRCVNNEIFHDFMIQTKGGIFQNPFGCDNGRTGILSYTCGEAPEL